MSFVPLQWKPIVKPPTATARAVKNTNFKRGQYVTDGGDVFAVLEAEDNPDYRGGQSLHLEDCCTGGSWDLEESANFKRCKKPLSCQQECKALYDLYAVHSVLGGPDVFKRFAREFSAILLKHGDSIHNQF